MVSNLSRVTLIVWLFSVFILTSSYTANLSSMLTVKQLKPSVANINDLKKSEGKVGYLTRSFVKDNLLKLGIHESRLLPLNSPQEYAEALTSGRVAAIVDETPYLAVFLNKYCDGYKMSNEIGKTGGFGFAFPKGSVLAADISRAILEITETDESSSIQQKWFDQEQTICTSKDGLFTSKKLGVSSFEGLFGVSDAVSGMCCIIILIKFYIKNKDKMKEIIADNPWKTSLKEIWMLFYMPKETENSSTESSEQIETIRKYDAVVGNITILANRSLYVDFTLPYTESGVRMVVPIKDINKKSPWAFLEPWTAKLWVTTGAFLLTGITVWFIEHRVNAEFRGDQANQIGSIFYFAFSTLVFAHKERLVSNLSRFLVIIWVFVVLILQQSYTASLTSKLTVEQLQPTVTNLEQVIKAGHNVGYMEDSFMPGLLKRLGVIESKIKPLSSPDEYNETISNGTVAAVVDEIPYLKVFLNQYSKSYTMVGPTYKTDGFGFAFPKGSPLVPDVSRAILKVMESENMTKFDQDLYGNSSFTVKEDMTSSTSLTFHSFMDLYEITGASSLLALIIHIIFSTYQRYNSPTRIGAAQNPIDQDEPRVDGSNGHQIITPNFTDFVEISVTPDSQSDIEEISNDEGTLGREIANNETEMPSFADMPDHIEEASHERF